MALVLHVIPKYCFKKPPLFRITCCSSCDHYDHILIMFVWTLQNFECLNLFSTNRIKNSGSEMHELSPDFDFLYHDDNFNVTDHGQLTSRPENLTNWQWSLIANFSLEGQSCMMDFWSATKPEGQLKIHNICHAGHPWQYSFHINGQSIWTPTYKMTLEFGGIHFRFFALKRV